MPRITYESTNFRGPSLVVVERANVICEEYEAAGYGLTLRQLYYRFVAAGWLPNTDRSYKNLGAIINKARLAGLIDWNHIEDRTRNLRRLPSWSSPAEIVQVIAEQYREPVWDDQIFYVEVWVEKDALVGVIGQAAETWDVPYFSCRGYGSQSELWGAAMRLIGKQRDGKHCVVLHLGDHDPSGIDMTRDISDRLRLFCEHHGRPAPVVRRIALNMDQVEQYEPPPNPAKVTDSRYEGYSEEHGEESWELDALPPDVLDALIQGSIRSYVDEEAWEAAKAAQEERRAILQAVSRSWPTIDEMHERGEL